MAKKVKKGKKKSKSSKNDSNGSTQNEKLIPYSLTAAQEQQKVIDTTRTVRNLKNRIENPLVDLRVRQVDWEFHDFFLTISRNATVVQLQYEIANAQHDGAVLPSDILLYKPYIEEPLKEDEESPEIVIGETGEEVKKSRPPSASSNPGKSNLGPLCTDPLQEVWKFLGDYDPLFETERLEDEKLEQQYLQEKKVSNNLEKMSITEMLKEKKNNAENAKLSKEAKAANTTQLHPYLVPMNVWQNRPAPDSTQVNTSVPGIIFNHDVEAYMKPNQKINSATTAKQNQYPYSAVKQRSPSIISTQMLKKPLTSNSFSNNSGTTIFNSDTYQKSKFNTQPYSRYSTQQQTMLSSIATTNCVEIFYDIKPYISTKSLFSTSVKNPQNQQYIADSKVLNSCSRQSQNLKKEYEMLKRNCPLICLESKSLQI
ncbi:hypothetical protein HK099_007966 [Clydaea vesicula]|uniref:Uncharacterized protein n=1 Tax=Clydaea vesicula TaxID=447962 RepID=A0AAD5TXZ5_9FUNG|nr:hypothetical protein HK099_007966 [Clydaea vesicula]